jgi:ketosteroid isomerase-like protein
MQKFFGARRAGSAFSQKAAAFFLLACACLSVAHAKSKDQAANQEAVSKLLQASAAAWSRGDLASFMQCYEESPTTEYVKNTGVVEGYTAIHDMYASKYGTGHAMGRLSLELMAYRQLGAAYALATGRFSLARPKPEGGDATGIFTLVFHRAKAGWHIIYDHTS